MGPIVMTDKLFEWFEHPYPAWLKELHGDWAFEFTEMEQAEAFAAAVRRSWDLEARILDAEAAARAHLHPPVVYVQDPHNPYGKLIRCVKTWRKVWEIGHQLENLTQKFGGVFVRHKPWLDDPIR